MVVAGLGVSTPGWAQPASPTMEEILTELGSDPDLGAIPLPSPPPPPPAWRFFVDTQYLGITNPRFENVRTETDNLFLGTVGLSGQPQVSEDLRLLASLSGTLARFGRETQSDFDRISGSLGLSWAFEPQSFLRLEVQGQHVNSVQLGRKFFSDVAVQLQIGHAQSLPDDVTFTYFYQLRTNFADPGELNRTGHSLNLALGIPLSDQVTTNLGYRFLISSYSNVIRTDLEHQLTAEIRYEVSPGWTVRGFTTYVNNHSTDSSFTFDSFAYGLGFNAAFPFN
ncbi:MAG: hypothetical protein OHK0012_26090 [Synechococcales cyanobacterium]